MTTTEQQTHTIRPAVVGPIGTRIYGDDHAAHDLSKEHVLPLGPSGGIILTKASCGKCRDKTSTFETACLRDDFGMVRTHESMPTRRPAERRTHRKLFVNESEQESVREVPLSEHTNVLALPEFSAAPAYLTGTVAPTLITVRMYANVDEIRRRTDFHTKAAIAVGGRFDVDAFVHLLAKNFIVNGVPEQRRALTAVTQSEICR